MARFLPESEKYSEQSEIFDISGTLLYGKEFFSRGVTKRTVHRTSCQYVREFYPCRHLTPPKTACNFVLAAPAAASANPAPISLRKGETMQAQNPVTNPPHTAPAFERLPSVKARTGLSRSEIYRRVSEGTFPRHVKLGEHTSGWVRSEIDAWIAGRIALRDGGAR
jgi:prophage regulatory protein